MLRRSIAPIHMHDPYISKGIWSIPKHGKLKFYQATLVYLITWELRIEPLIHNAMITLLTSGSEWNNPHSFFEPYPHLGQEVKPQITPISGPIWFTAWRVPLWCWLSWRAFPGVDTIDGTFNMLKSEDLSRCQCWNTMHALLEILFGWNFEYTPEVPRDAKSNWGNGWISLLANTMRSGTLWKESGSQFRLFAAVNVSGLGP